MDARLAGLDWARIGEDLDRRGWAVAPILSPEACANAIALWREEDAFRKQVVMERHGFGQGLYKYWRYPLPSMIASLRNDLYAGLAPIAERWRQRLGAEGTPFPASHEDYLARCHAAGQTLPTPLLLRYEAEGYNCLHQDLYGAHVFPMQAAFLLSRPELDFTGGEFALVEQRPRAQSCVEVVPLARGDMVVFAVDHRPLQGSRGWYRTRLRHGVSRVRTGERYTLGIILHDAAS
ncbi:MAG TPA: 2OG-Fe(II) oxygenase [Aliidongia sp.]|nr:2OG-Fe(II) oxygenase [Aliidongia sp.]